MVLSKKRIFALIVFSVYILSFFSLSPVYASEEKPYSTFIKTYKRNDITVEFPQIKGLSDENKQEEINYLLEKEIFHFLTYLFNGRLLGMERKVTNILQTISDTDYTKDITFDIDCNIEFSNEDSLSIRYSVYYSHQYAAHPTTWGYAYTVDLNEPAVLNVSDLLNIDYPLLELEGSCVLYRNDDPTPYELGVKLYDKLIFNNFRYDTKEEILEMIKSAEYKSCYITKERRVSFFFSPQSSLEQEIEVDFEIIKEYINPFYREKLNNW